MVALTSELITPVGKDFGSLSLRILVERFMSQCLSLSHLYGILKNLPEVIIARRYLSLSVREFVT